MALNKKIVTKVKEKTSDDSVFGKQLQLLLTRIENGNQPKREIEKILKEIR